MVDRRIVIGSGSTDYSVTLTNPTKIDSYMGEVLKQPFEISTIAIDAERLDDIAPFTFYLYLPGGERAAYSETFVPLYGSHKAVKEALYDGRFTIDTNNADIELLHYLWDEFGENLAQIPAFAYLAKQAEW